MSALRSLAPYVLAAAAAGAACRLPRPQVEPFRMVEPQIELPRPADVRADAAAIRMLDTQARGHVGHRVLHRLDNGELIEDRIWRWSSLPDRYLDSAVRSMVAGSPDLRLVDTARAPTVSMNLVEWYLDDTGTRRLVGAVEVTVTLIDRTVATGVVRAHSPVSADLPGDLAAVAGQVLGTLARDGVRLAGEFVRRPARAVS